MPVGDMSNDLLESKTTLHMDFLVKVVRTAKIDDEE